MKIINCKRNMRLCYVRIIYEYNKTLQKILLKFYKCRGVIKKGEKIMLNINNGTFDVTLRNVILNSF